MAEGARQHTSRFSRRPADIVDRTIATLERTKNSRKTLIQKGAERLQQGIEWLNENIGPATYDSKGQRIDTATPLHQNIGLSSGMTRPVPEKKPVRPKPKPVLFDENPYAEIGDDGK